MSRAILLSGGMDSIALAYWQKPSTAITIDYGHAPAEAEIRASRKVSEILNMTHHVIRVDCGQLGSGDLINSPSIPASPSTEWWPYRNQLLITLAAMKSISLGIEEIMLASIKSDDFHKDGTSIFYQHMNAVMKYQEGNISITSPCIDLTTLELIKISKVPRNLLFWAHSCHTSNIPCGRCRGCNKYINTTTELNNAPNYESIS